MIAQLRGLLIDKGSDQVTVEVGGVGLRVAVSLTTLAALPPVGREATLVTALIVRPNADEVVMLVGFATTDERQAFELLTSVQGIGPKLALAVLSALDVGALGSALRDGDHARLVRIPGIGKKSAERLVLELRDKFPRAASPTAGRAGGLPALVSALTNLGYRPQEAERAAAQAEREGAGASVAELLKAALRILAE